MKSDPYVVIHVRPRLWAGAEGDGLRLSLQAKMQADCCTDWFKTW